jgi:DNA-binding transcriptional regulator YhcF (GntR family)
MSYSAMAWARAIKTGSPTVKAVLLAVANYADEEGICWPSQDQLAEDTELSRHSIMRAIEQLEEMDLLTRERRHRKDGSRTSDLIMLDLSRTVQRSTEQRSSEQRSTQQQPKSHSATAEPIIEPSSIPSSGRASKPKGEEQLAFDAFNDIAAETGIPKAQVLTPERKSKLRQRLNECGGLTGWLDAMSKIRGSPFLCGDNDRGWKANLDFLLRPASFTRLMEGSYDRQRQSRAQAHSKPTTRDGLDMLDAVTDEAIRLATGCGPESSEEDFLDLPGLRKSAA